MDKQTLLPRIVDLTEPLSPDPVGHDTRLKKLDSIRCVAFDFYGTMFISGVGDIGIDEEQDTRNASFFRSALTATGFNTSGEESGILGIDIFQKTIKQHIGRKQDEGIEYPEPDIIAVWREVLQTLSEEGLIEGDITEDHAIRFAIEFEFRVNNIWPVPDLGQVLRELHKRSYALGIISNSQFYTPLAFEAIMGNPTETFGFDPNLQIWSYATGMKKPSVSFYKVFTDALEQHTDFKPQEVLYVGNDIRKDIQPAKQLGLRTALFVGDSRSVRHENRDLEQAEFQPDLIIDDLAQIIDCI